MNFSTTPYFDDYSVEKGYYKILFKPGKAVQARELTQLQTALQKQVEHIGTHIFKDGARVLNGAFSYNSEYHSVKLTSIFGNQSVDDYIDQLMDLEIVGETSGVKARVINYTQSDSIDPPTIYVSYIATGDDGDIAFVDDENLVVPGVLVNGVDPGLPVLTTAAVGASHIGAAASVEAGIFYTLGHFVFCDVQTVILSKYSNTPTGRIGLLVQESIVDANQDLSLLDNSQGTSNFAAPGADRYAITLTLASIGVDEIPSDQFIEFERVNTGRLLGKARTGPYNVLEDNIAKRTFDTNGDFIAEEFRIRMRESLNNGNNNGVFESTQLTDDGSIPNDNLMSLHLSQGKAFVQGYRIETTQPSFIDVEKPRTTLEFVNTSLALEVGNYVQIQNTFNLPDIVGEQGNPNFEPYAIIDLYDTVNAVGGVAPVSKRIGVARPRSMEFADSTNSTVDSLPGTSAFRLHLFDIKMFTEVTFAAPITIPAAGSMVIGDLSGATGLVHSSSAGSTLNLTSSVGDFFPGETVTSTSSDASVGSTVSNVIVHDFSSVRSMHSTTDNFTADTVLVEEKDVLGNGTGVFNSLLEDQDKNLMLRKLPKDFVATLEADLLRLPSMEVRREFVATTDTNGDGEFTLTCGFGETFNAPSNLDYQISVMTAGSGSAAAGDVINIDSANLAINGSGSNSITFTSASIFGASATVKVMTTINRQDTLAKQKTAQRVQMVKVQDKSTAGGSVYGTSSHHREISLGVADVFKVRAIYSSGAIGVDAVTPTLVVSAITGGVFQAGDSIVGSVSGATGTIVDPVNMTYVSDNGSLFSIGETVSNGTVSATVSSYTLGSTDVTNRYLLDDGQRDNFYDISRLVLKPRKIRPVGDLLVVFDYFDHNAGDYFSVDSYSDISYSEIPFYSSTRIDPESSRPDGLFDLRSTLDFRPRVGNIATGVVNGYTVITGSSFDVASRVYSSTIASASVIGTPKDNANFECDFDYYIGRKDTLVLTPAGRFEYITGTPAENPVAPQESGTGLRLADIHMHPYVLDITKDVEVKVHDAKRYTMKDISRLETRIENVEYYTSLSLLEQNAESLQIKDANGLDRFKSGFLVDDFSGHRIGHTTHQDYRCAIDMQKQILRPKFSMKSVDLVEADRTTADRTASGYKKSGNIVTLPFTNEALITQRFATRIENVNPHLDANWIGDLELSPSQDVWFDTDRIPSVTVNKEGNYNAVLQANKNNLGTVWDAPVTQWAGTTRNVTRETTRLGGWRRTTETVTSVTTGTQTWSGIKTDIVASTSTQSIGDKVVGTNIIPFMRENDIVFEAHGLKPNTQVYPFLDGINVSNYCSMVTGKPRAVAGTTTTKAFTSNIWGALTSLSVYYDNNENASVRFTVSVSDTEDGTYTQVATGTTTATKTATYNADTLTFTSPAGPNEFGEKFVKIAIQRVDNEPVSKRGSRAARKARRAWLKRGNRFAGSLRDSVFTRLEKYGNNSSLQISEVIVGSSSGALDSSKYVNVHSVSNILNPDMMIDGTINTTSQRSVKSESQVTYSKEGTAEIILRVIGGTAVKAPSNGLSRFIPAGSYNTAALVTDFKGSVSGVFHLPDPNIPGAPKFETGTKEFALSSSPVNLKSGTHTWATSTYSAKGTLNIIQETLVATRNAKIIKTEVSKATNVTRTTSTTSTRWFDPLAQSIAIDVEGGAFVTAVDLFFFSKDTQLPVTIQLRTMENGIPTSDIIPLSTVTLPPSKVNTSENGLVATTFSFESPIHLPKDTEVALVVLSNSKKYNVFISQMGENDIATQQYVSEQPYLGVLFKSQNSSTWSPSVNEDLKFTLYRAKFNTGTGTVTFNNEKLATKTLDTDPFSIREIDTVNGTTTIRVDHPDHGMYDEGQNRVTFEGAKTNAYGTLRNEIGPIINSIVVSAPSLGFPEAIADQTFIIRSQSVDAEDEVILADVSLFDNVNNTVTLSNVTRAVNGVVTTGHDAGATVEYYQVDGFSLDLINTTHSISNVLIDSYDIVIPAVATTAASFGGDGVEATENYMVDSYQVMIPSIVLPGTSINSNLTMHSGTSPNGTQGSYTSVVKGNTTPTTRYHNSLPTMIASEVNELSELAGNKSLSYTMTLSTTNDYLSPIVDLERTAFICYNNRLDFIKDKYLVDNLGNAIVIPDYKAPTEPEGDSGEAVYITKRVQLSNPATALKVLHAALRSPTSDIQVMYKILRSDDTSSFEELGWNYFNPTYITDANGDQMLTGGGPDTPVAPVEDGETFIDYDYTVNDLPEFISFAIKIKMNGTNTSDVPQIKDLRAIALAV